MWHTPHLWLHNVVGKVNKPIESFVFEHMKKRKGLCDFFRNLKTPSQYMFS